jgi:1,3-beta-glucanosyltransferase GAS5
VSYRNAELLNHFFKAVDAFSKHPSILGIVVSDAVINNSQCMHASSTIRAVVRDVKRYIRLRADIHGTRLVPVGVTSRNWLMITRPLLEYFTAGSPEERVGFYSSTNFSWAGQSSIYKSGWVHLVSVLSQPILGCVLQCASAIHIIISPFFRDRLSPVTAEAWFLSGGPAASNV